MFCGCQKEDPVYVINEQYNGAYVLTEYPLVEADSWSQEIELLDDSKYEIKYLYYDYSNANIDSLLVENSFVVTYLLEAIGTDEQGNVYADIPLPTRYTYSDNVGTEHVAYITYDVSEGNVRFKVIVDDGTYDLFKDNFSQLYFKVCMMINR